MAKWERLNSENHKLDRPATVTDRMKVPGGWLYRTLVKALKSQNGYGREVAMCFVPDPKDD